MLSPARESTAYLLDRLIEQSMEGEASHRPNPMFQALA